MSPLRRLARGVTMVAMLGVVACELAIDLSPYTANCGAGTKECNVNGANACVNTNNIAYGCGRPGCTPCFVQNATPVCDKALTCQVGVCFSGFLDCDNRPDDGCEVNGNTDYNHCGISSVSCKTSCADTLNNIVGFHVLSTKCSSGGCVVDQCAQDWKDCDTAVTNGCEKNVGGSVCGPSSNQPCCGLCDGCPGTLKCDTTANPPKCVSADAGAANAADAAGDAAGGD